MTRFAQLLLIASAGALWGASRLAWVSVRSFDGLGQPRSSTITGAMWSTALLPLAVLLLATAVAGLAVRGWALRVVAMLVAVVSVALGYLAISLVAGADVGPRAAALAGVPVITLVGAERHVAGAVVTAVAAVSVLLAAVLLIRAAGVSQPAGQYAAPRPHRHADAEAEGAPQLSERGMWDALDEGLDPTDREAGVAAAESADSGIEGR